MRNRWKWGQRLAPLALGLILILLGPQVVHAEQSVIPEVSEAENLCRSIREKNSEYWSGIPCAAKLGNHRSVRIIDPAVATVFRTQDTVSGNPRELYVLQYLTETMEMSPAAACGIMANMMRESRFHPMLLQGSYRKSLGYESASYTCSTDKGAYLHFEDDHGGYGLCQWTSHARKKGLLALAKETKRSVADLDVQLEFLQYELANKYSEVGDFLRKVENSPEGAAQAGSYFCIYYEKPKRVETSSVKRGRLAAEEFWPRYGGYTPGRDSVEVEIPEPVKGSVVYPKLTMNTEKAQLAIGDTLRLKASFGHGSAVDGLKWTTDNKAVAVVDASGKVTAKGNGSCVITAANSGGVSCSCRILVGEQESTENLIGSEESPADNDMDAAAPVPESGSSAEVPKETASETPEESVAETAQKPEETTTSGKEETTPPVKEETIPPVKEETKGEPAGED